MQFWKSHGTKILGILSLINGVTAALIAIAGLVPIEHLKYWLAVSAVSGILGASTFLRGFTNSAALNSTPAE